ncbi:SusC/RagA family TonB-linked outer membrane protein [Pontibacter sp. G13]|uniref:SusC/RagA family TonB-linked outer membrane protein n=1 Tax=Pontibacter sp. G13 TaxID=3074898 RepID=UPI0028892E66|nr:SusC/RagA family TonB-linked outer membrane protein [Pontibacter sp. G13]WNJ20552.1 SusC/RagA family TonB-linked outer membrane protein [Pontibacter sp. G13]
MKKPSRMGWMAAKGTMFLLAVLMNVAGLQAQSRAITGKVVDAANNEPLIGANVLVSGTTAGAITDNEGAFSLNAPDGSNELTVSYLGYTRQTVSIEGVNKITISLEAEATATDEVVITALGIKRDKKALGYAVTEVNSDMFTTARETNVLNALSGRIAGVQINNGSSGTGSSSRIVIRGESSFTDNVQPLIVVDGVPIHNQIVANQTRNDGGSQFQEVDYGNGLGELSSDDIASVSVLKGPAATALYGSRGANGVLVITTKNGKGTKGIGVSINSSVTFETPLRIPQYQNDYGQGSNGNFSFANGLYGGVEDGEDISWGPKMDGQNINQFDSPSQDLAGNVVRAGDIIARGGDMQNTSLPQTDITATPWVARPDNVRDFFETGLTLINNVALSGANEAGDVRLSYTNLENQGIIPNSDLHRNSISLSAGYELNDKLSTRAYINYINSASNHRPGTGYGSENPMYIFTWYGRQVNTENLEDYWQAGQENVQQFNYNYAWHDNPYFAMIENTNGFDKNRVLGNLSVSYEFLPELKLTVRSGMDAYNDVRDSRRAFSTQRFRNGAYREDEVDFREMNTDFLLTYDNRFGDNFGLTASIGANRMDQEVNYKFTQAGELIVPGIYNFENSRIPLVIGQFNQRKQINSVYGLAQMSLNDALYLDLSVRNDWSSTLPADNNSYLYGAASLSAVVSEMVDLPAQITFLKLRLSGASVGNDTDPYSLTNTFVYGQPYGSTQTVTSSATLANADISPERVNSIEGGLDFRMFNNRVRLDVAGYGSVSNNQIISLPTSTTSGYSGRVVNGAQISTRGIEASLGLTLAKTSDFQWDVNANFSRNVSKVSGLDELGVDQYVINFGRVYSRSDRSVYIIATEDGKIGDMYGTGLMEIDGKAVYNEDGIPVKDPNLRYLGNYNPDFIVGFENNFNFKGINVGFLLDWRQGGTIVSRTLSIASTSGNLEHTVYGREEGVVGGSPEMVAHFQDEYGISMLEGVNESGEANGVAAPAQTWYNRYFDRDNEANHLYDASYLKLREVRVGYTLPQSVSDKLNFEQIRVSFIGKNLFVLTQNNHFDPELNSMQGSRFVQGIEDMSYPSARSFGLNLSLQL